MNLFPLRRPLGALALALAAALPAGAATPIEVPFQQFTLDNGLRVVVHEDHKAPIVAVNLWYHIGSKDEEAGKTGFAHLFEHLMFQGSENHKGEFFEPFEQAGATEQNGTTGQDRTNYFENVPTTALDMALWMESDRMGHFAGAIDQSLLDEQRGVVKNEKRQGENQPYGRVWQQLFAALFPLGHPYHALPIGSMEDLDRASLDDVKQWFANGYGPNNAVLVLAGDIDLDTAKQKVTRYFGDIEASPPLARHDSWVGKRHESTRDVLIDRVPQVRLYKAWNVAEYGSVDADRLQLFSQLFGGSATSRLDRRLVHELQLADNVGSFVMPMELAGVFAVQVTVKNGVDPAKVEAIVDEELAKLIKDGPSKQELAQAKTMLRAQFVRGLERVGGFGGKSDALAECTVYTGKPDCFVEQFANIESTSVADLQQLGRRWLADGDYTLTVQPFADYKTVASDVDRSTGVPTVEKFPEVSFPALQRATLKNGVEVVLAERHEVPVVQVSMQFPGGYASDQGRPLGTSSFTMGMLDEGAGKRDALALKAAGEALGAYVGGSASLDAASVYLSALADQLAPSLDLFADVVRRPRFDPADIERVRKQWLANIRQEKSRPNTVGYRLLPPLLYGDGHAYAMPFTGSGTEASIAALTRDDLVRWHHDFVRPDNATVIVVGDTTLAEVMPLLEARFGDWQAPQTPVPPRNIADVPRPEHARVYLVDQPGALQANILVGELVGSTMAPDAVAFDLANDAFGGLFSARLNMNLREDKSWSYGAYSFTPSARGQRPWMLSAPVQIDKTVESIAEIRREIGDYVGTRPATHEELAKVRAQSIRGMPGSYETADAVMGTIGGILRFERPDDWVVQLQRQTATVPDETVQQAATTIDPQKLTWVVVGDLKKIEQPIRALGLGEVQVIDGDGKPVAH